MQFAIFAFFAHLFDFFSPKMHLFFSDFSQRICFGTIFAWFTKFSKLFHLFLRIFVFLKLTFSLWFLTIIFLGNFYVRMIFAPFLSKLNVFAHFFSMIVLNAHFFDNIFAHFFSRQDKPPPPPPAAQARSWCGGGKWFCGLWWADSGASRAGGGWPSFQPICVTPTSPSGRASGGEDGGR